MFERLSHLFNRENCINHLYWDSKDNLKCSVCDEIAAIRSKDVIHVFEGYGAYENTITNQYGKPHSKSQEDDEWKDAKDSIRKWQIEEDPSYIPHLVIDDGEMPFADGFDDEDSAAGDLYVDNDAPSDEDA